MGFITTFIYQPFFNLLVAYYDGLSRIPGQHADMGVAVILLTITIRILMLPLTISATRTQKERRDIEENINRTRDEYRNNPILQKEEIRKTFKKNRRVIISEAINFTIQMAIFFILYRIFTTGLGGADMHLLYSFMPDIAVPHNALVFLGKYDLTHPNLTLNFIQSITIFIVEAVNLIDSPFPTTRNEFVRYTLILPLASFFIFLFLPAGKKLFVITTLWFSILYTTLRILMRLYRKFLTRLDTLGVNPVPAGADSAPSTAPKPENGEKPSRLG